MRIYSLLIATGLLFSCGDGEKKGDVETLPMTTSKQELSYLVGADHAHQLDKDPNKAKYSKEQLLKGFCDGLDNPDAFDNSAQQDLMKCVGDGQFNEAFNSQGSLAIGKLFGTTFSQSWTKLNFMSEFDKKYIIYGFELGLRDQDTLIEEGPKQKMMADLMDKLNTRISAEVTRTEKVFFDKIKKKPGIKELPQGLYMETIKEGSGANPKITDDVLTHYSLMNTNGDTLQTSLGSEPVGFNLSGVIPGWSVGIPFMKKGGKYKLYVPQAMGYGAQGTPDGLIPPFSILVFYIELHNIGEAGTLSKR